MSLISSHKESSWEDLGGNGLDFESLVMLSSSSSFFSPHVSLHSLRLQIVVRSPIF